MASVIAALMTVMLLPSAHAYGWWINQPYDSLDEYNTRAAYLTNVTLVCNNKTPGDGYTFLHWVLPDMTMARVGFSRSFSTFKDGPAGWHVTSDAEMVAINVHEEHFGFYTCLVEKDATHYAVKRSLNADGAYFPDLWDKYRRQTLVAIGASGIFLLMSISGCLLYNYKVQRHEERGPGGEQDKTEPAPDVEGGKKSDGYKNKAFHVDDQEMTNTTL